MEAGDLVGVDFGDQLAQLPGGLAPAGAQGAGQMNALHTGGDQQCFGRPLCLLVRQTGGVVGRCCRGRGVAVGSGLDMSEAGGGRVVVGLLSVRRCPHIPKLTCCWLTAAEFECLT